MRYAFPRSLRGATWCILAVQCRKNPLAKPDLKSVVIWHTQFSILNSIKLRSLPMHSVIQALFSLYFLYTGYFYTLMVYSHGGRKTK